MLRRVFETVHTQIDTSNIGDEWTRKRLLHGVLARPAAAHARQHKRRVFIGKRVFEKSWAYRNENRSDRSSRNARASFGEGKR
jgi:hypothetical protein